MQKTKLAIRFGFGECAKNTCFIYLNCWLGVTKVETVLTITQTSLAANIKK